MHGKVKRQGRYAGQRPDWKKAYVVLAEGREDDRVLRPGIGEEHGTQEIQSDVAGPAVHDRPRPSTRSRRRAPEKSLTEPKKRTGGRNNRGRITVRFRGGGHKQRYRIVDFRRDKPGVPAKVAAIEYDPNRSARLALLHYADGEKRYILWPEGLAVGATVVAGESADILPGNCLPLKVIPAGTMIHNIELRHGKGGQMVRTRRRRRAAGGQGRRLRAGQAALGRGAQGRASTARPPSARSATSSTRTSRYGKAGRKRWLGTQAAQPRRRP